MTEIRYDISQLFNLAFGIGGKMFTYPGVNVEEESPVSLDYSGIELVETDDVEEYSHLGTPWLYPLTLKGGTYNIYQDGQIVETTVEDFRLPPTTLVEFSQGKVTNKTRVPGRKGTVKEMSGFDDWRIRIRGLLIGEESQQFPTEQLRKLKAFKDLASSVEVEDNEIFNELEIYEIFIEEISLPVIERFPWVRPFELRCISDEPIELILK